MLAFPAQRVLSSCRLLSEQNVCLAHGRPEVMPGLIGSFGGLAGSARCFLGLESWAAKLQNLLTTRARLASPRCLVCRRVGAHASQPLQVPQPVLP